MVDTRQHIIDGDASPKDAEGWAVQEHRPCGLITWDPSKIQLYLDPWQDSHKEVITGHELYSRLATMPILNANILDYLLENQHLIPDEWKKDKDKRILNILFWGTIYYAKGYPGPDHFQVHGLTWNKHHQKWLRVSTHLDFQFFQESPAVIIINH